MRLSQSPTPALDVDCILENILKKTRTFLMAHGEMKLSPEQVHKFHDDIARRATGLPVAYITGYKEFYGLDFLVTPDVLIPKPDTELLVEQALKEIYSRTPDTADYAQDSMYRMIDVCTGSGCIAVSVLHELRNKTSGNAGNRAVTLTDISPEALAIAKQNAGRLLGQDTMQSIRFLQGDLLNTAGTEEKYDLILSNPPYIPAAEVTELLEDGRKEPRLALDGDAGDSLSKDGLAVIRRLILQAWEHLAPGGLFLCETGEYNAKKAMILMKAAGFRKVTAFRDLAGQLRLIQGRS
jgi:release factor glutamine methyltransferase